LPQIKNAVFTGRACLWVKPKSEEEMNKPALIACLIISIILFSSNICLAQQNFTADIQALKENPKINLPDTVLEDFMKGKLTTRVIVNLRDPLAQDPTFDQDSNNRDRSPGVSRPVRNNLKELPVRRRLQTDVNDMQNRVINFLDMDTMRITNRFKYIFGFSAEITLQGLQNLAKHPDVLSIDEDMILHANLAQGIPLMNASAITGIYNGSGMAIAICDTGIDYNHPMLGGGGFPNDKVIGGYDTGEDDFDPIDGNGHGTACAGIAAGSLGNTGDYIGGVAHNAKLYALKISNTPTGGSAYTSDMVEAWELCITHQNDDPLNPIMIISMSFGGGRYTDQADCDNYSSAMTAAAANARAVGITLFVSSGNDGYCDAMGWPGCLSDVISVGAVYDANIGRHPPAGNVGCIMNESCVGTPGICPEKWYVDDPANADQVTTYSNTASFLSLFAPAEWAYTTKLGGGYWDTPNGFGGTSAACPYAAGAAAVLQSMAKARTGAYLTPDQVESYLTDYGDLITDTKAGITKPRINLQNSTDAVTLAALEVINQAVADGSGSSGCFIGTAAYGSPVQPYVKILREFRNRILLNNSIGKTLVNFYYKYSPPMADCISRHDSLRAMVRIFLLPVVGMSWMALKFGPASTLGLLLLFSLMSASGLIYLRKTHLRRHGN
jgi:subtilisin family serine protease